ncbi:MAG: hypothetical protein HOI06_01395 [Pelagibacteraceae bacterium]|jgi:hypothetical protein|nr:hypothetical protein [Pelagibacteraceae bacterium]MBT4950179.1 hypothetical protein [Pelagibacteraceae bacterium]MBT5213153.1 hypothetical protein [Pelagibacteraceae bacterium]MBT6197423.1 hypothetical protein [Pelagibacteraceae bacterium]MBT6355401.1 hypothetical protein [Pelagibacteraceae bacterium]
MIIKTPVSLGELVDKISILYIKNSNIKDEAKLKLIRDEMDMLIKTLDEHILKDKIQIYLDSLIEINSKLWVIEDDIRDCERKKKFDQKFIELARSVYFTNDKRSEVKLNINNKFGSKIVEVKSYEKY